MKLNYNLELSNILENIYKEMIYKIAINNINIDFTKDNLDVLIKLLVHEDVYLGNDMDDFIISCIPTGHDGNLFRCAIAKHHHTLHPRFENYKGEPIVDSTYNKFSLLLWEGYMNTFLISDLQNLFSQDEFISFVNNKLDSNIEEIIYRINEYKSKTITINFDKKQYLLNVVKNMILRNELDFDYANMLVDMDKLRDSMAKMSAAFHIYDEYDKLKDDTRYCLDNFCKYNAFELYDFLVNTQGFELLDEGCLIKK
jgi:hypothetical protein